MDFVYPTFKRKGCGLQQVHSWLGRVVAIETLSQTDLDQNLLTDNVHLRHPSGENWRMGWPHLVSLDDVRLALDFRKRSQQLKSFPPSSRNSSCFWWKYETKQIQHLCWFDGRRLLGCSAFWVNNALHGFSEAFEEEIKRRNPDWASYPLRCVPQKNSGLSRKQQETHKNGSVSDRKMSGYGAQKLWGSAQTQVNQQFWVFLSAEGEGSSQMDRAAAFIHTNLSTNVFRLQWL